MRYQNARPCHASLRRLRVRGANVDSLQQLLECVPALSELQLDGPALSIKAAASLCPWLRRVAYLVCSPYELDAALRCLSRMRDLRALELEVKGMVLSTEQLRVSAASRGLQQTDVASLGANVVCPQCAHVFKQRGNVECDSSLVMLAHSARTDYLPLILARNDTAGCMLTVELKSFPSGGCTRHDY
jgi:hypothetical protein